VSGRTGSCGSTRNFRSHCHSGHAWAHTREQQWPSQIWHDGFVDDADLLREAQRALERAGELTPWAQRFNLLSDAGRLRLLFCVHRAPGIRVGDLAIAAQMSESAVSHALRLLRTSGWVTATRDGRSIRYALADDDVHELLHTLGASHQDRPTAPNSPQTT